MKDYRHPKNVPLTPGTGQVDVPTLMARLRKEGFAHGPLVIETLAPSDPATRSIGPRRHADSSRNWLAILASRSRWSVRNAVAPASVNWPPSPPRRLFAHRRVFPSEGEGLPVLTPRCTASKPSVESAIWKARTESS